MDKNGISRKNIIDFAFISILAISLIFILNPILASTYSSVFGGNNSLTTNVINYTNISWPDNIVNEDWSHVYNISINKTTADTNYNITSVNISLPSNFVYTLNLYTVTTGSNQTGNYTADAGYGAAFFRNDTDASGVTVLSWNMTGGTDALIFSNNSGPLYFTFNATATNPGKYNISVKVSYNQSEGVAVYNETNITVWVNDTTSPENVTFSGQYGLNKSIAAIAHSVGNYSGDLLLNISTADNGNQIKSVFFNITYANQTTNGTNWFFEASNSSGSTNYWFYNLDTRKLPDGTYNVTVFVNDTNGNINRTRSINITVDNTVPSGSMVCTPTEDIYVGQSISCVCTASDAFVGITDAGPSYTTSPSSDNAGVYTQTCTFYDRAGNNGTATDSYTIWGSPSSGTSSSSGGAAFTYSKTFSQTYSDFSEIASIETSTFSGGGLAVKQRVTFTLNNEQHHVGIRALTTSSVTVEIASDPVQVELDIGEEIKQDLDGDGFYDVYVKLNGITNGKADLTINYINEEIPEGEGTTSTTGEQLPGEGTEQPTGGIPIWVWIVVGVIVVAIIIGGGVALKKKK